MEYSKFRVSSPIRTFRDLEVYQKTISLSAEIVALQFLKDLEFEKDRIEIKEITEKIPRLIAESYGDRFDSVEVANKKLSEALTFITDIITKIDLLRARFLGVKENKEILDKLLINYIYQKTKVLNLRKAWSRVFENKDRKVQSQNNNDEKYEKPRSNYPKLNYQNRNYSNTNYGQGKY